MTDPQTITETDLNVLAQRFYETSDINLPAMTDKPQVVAGLRAVFTSIGYTVEEGDRLLTADPEPAPLMVYSVAAKADPSWPTTRTHTTLVLAVPSRVAAGRIFRSQAPSLVADGLALYGGVTIHPDRVAAAKSQPGVVLVETGDPARPYVPVAPPTG